MLKKLNYNLLTVGMGVAVLASAPASAKLDSFAVSQLIYRQAAIPANTQNSREKTQRNSRRIVDAQDMVVELKENGLPVAAMANIFQVERKTIYAWSSGAKIQPHNQSRIRKIYELLSESKTASFRNLYRFWSLQLDNSKSLSTLLSSDSLDGEAITNVLGYLWPMANRAEEREVAVASKKTAGKNPILRDMAEASVSNS